MPLYQVKTTTAAGYDDDVYGKEGMDYDTSIAVSKDAIAREAEGATRSRFRYDILLFSIHVLAR